MEDPIHLKEDGNKFFKESDIVKAIECYSKALKLAKDKKLQAVLYRNRSACYLKQVCYNKPILQATVMYHNLHLNGEKLEFKLGFCNLCPCCIDF